jgi:DDE family transposase
MRRKTGKATYHLRDWREYNAALIQRGSLTLWVSEEVLGTWHDDARTGKRGAPRTYSDSAIRCMAWLSAVYRLALRTTQGLLSSVLKLLKVALPVPDYTTLCRRRRKLAVSLPRGAKDEPLHVVVEATGVRVYGEGEWKVRGHGGSKRRTQAASCMWASMRPLVSLSRLPLPPMILEMDNYCLSCLTRSTRTLCRSQAMGPMTRGCVMPRSVRVKPRRRFRQDVVRVSGATAIQMTRR